LSQSPSVVISHFAACVSDVEKSTRFYTEALGFEIDMQVEVTPPFEKLTELPEIRARATFFNHGAMGIRFEILQYDKPGTIGPAGRRPMNQLGLTHMGVVVDDLEAVAARIVEHGGEVHWHTKVSGPHGDMVFANDPDGLRLELWKKPA
jgi:lactoylglutathione lyase